MKKKRTLSDKMQGQEEVQHPTALPVLPLALSREDVMVVNGFDFVKVGEGLLLVAVLLLLSAKEGQVMGQEHVQHPKRKIVQWHVCGSFLDCLHRGIGSRFVNVNVKSAEYEHERECVTTDKG